MEALKDDRFSYSDYCSWPDDQRWEIIEGRAYNMTPAPGIGHQTVLGELHALLRYKLKEVGSRCALLMAPTDVVFDDFNVVQPDLLIVCDRSKITEKNIQGPPDVIFEIKSPSTERKDRLTKFALYEKHGVETYILVHPTGFMEVFRLENGHYGAPLALDSDGVLVLEHPKISLPLEEIFLSLLPESNEPTKPPPIP